MFIAETTCLAVADCGVHQRQAPRLHPLHERHCGSCHAQETGSHVMQSCCACRHHQRSSALPMPDLPKCSHPIMQTVAIEAFCRHCTWRGARLPHQATLAKLEPGFTSIPAWILEQQREYLEALLVALHAKMMNGTGQHFPEPNMRFPEPADRMRADDDVEAQTSEEDIDMDYHEDQMADVNVEGGMTVAFKVRAPASISCQLHCWRGDVSMRCAAEATYNHACNNL